jgi:hypothetical protein
MTLVISKGITLAKTFYGLVADLDARDYLARVHAAEGQTLEPEVCLAIEAFIVGCKADGIWPAIKASCILAGARTLSGALVPLVGTAPTNFNFVSGDYNRKTGLVGNGSTKYLNSNRAGNADPQNNIHLSVYLAERNEAATARRWISGNEFLLTVLGSLGATGFRARVNTTVIQGEADGVAFAPGIVGVSRGDSSNYNWRYSSAGGTRAVASTGSDPVNIHVFTNPTLAVGNFSASRFAFYSIGESLDLALLDARVTDLINAFGAAIP